MTTPYCSIAPVIVWEASLGTDIEHAIADMLEVVKLLDRGLSGDYGQLRRYRLIHNNIVLDVDADATAEQLLKEFHVRQQRGEGLYGSKFGDDEQ